jgi:hypothetical protein
MNHNNQSSWECMEFPTLNRKVPSELMIGELVICQHSEFSFKTIQKDLDIGSNKLLYTMLSLRSYGLRQESIDSKSQAVLRYFNNQLVLMMKNELGRSKFDEICMTFCERKGIDYEVLQYHEAVVSYCLRILPLPLNYVRNVDNDSALAVFVAGSLSQMKSSGEVPRHPDPKLAAYQSRKAEAERRAANMFIEYRLSKYYLSLFSHALELEHPEVYQERFLMNYSTVTSNRNYRHSKGSRQQDILLCRCEFCYRFRKIERKRGVDPAWHCDRQKCKQHYRHWINHLNTLSGKDIYLETLY